MPSGVYIRSIRGNMKMMDRIINSYLKEKNTRIPKPYRYSGIWDKTEHRFKELHKEIKNGNKDSFIQELKNFYKNKMSTGISVFKDMPSNSKEIAELVNYIEKNMLIWQKLFDSPIPEINYPKNIDFPKIIRSSLRLCYYAKRISELSEGNVVEIGGGFGGMIYHLIYNYGFGRIYLDFDLPEILLMEKYFLMSAFPEKKFLLYGEDDIKNFNKYDIILMPHWEIRNLPDNSCDLIFNAHSLSEMGDKQIKEYLQHIHRITTNYFLYFNHDGQAFYIKKKSLGKWCPKMDGWKLIYRFLEILSDGENVDYFEYLYEKNNKRPF